MEGIQRFFGVVLIVIAAIVAIHTVIEPIYHTSTSEHPYSRTLENNRSAIRDFYNRGLGIRIPSHASRPQEFER